MPTLSPADRRFLLVLADLAYCNPFEPRRLALERDVLGDQYTPESVATWSRTEATDRHERPNVARITARASQVVERLREAQHTGDPLAADDAALYDDAVTYTLYYRHVASLSGAALTNGGAAAIGSAWRAFRDERRRLLAPNDAASATTDAHLFACLHQVRRAFFHVFDCLIGESSPAARLRAEAWQSIFTHDLRRYRRTLYCQMKELATLVTGPSGAGKELVAQAIGRSQFWPFDASAEQFAITDDAHAVTALNLSAMSPTLIESELFGHKKGAFTGAASERVGWLERCPPHGVVFLDEIGELDPAIQVKLLRVAQSRDFSRLGESRVRRFGGKLIAATNRDLAAEMRAGRFREDLYYRLCSDHIVAPSLREQIADHPACLGGLVRFLARRVLGADSASDSGEVERLALEVEAWIRDRLPTDYPWPGNTRELEQCVRSVLVRREYRPASLSEDSRSSSDWLRRAARCELSADELLNAYCHAAHQRAGGYEPAGALIGLDRRTVKSRCQAHADNTRDGG